MTKQVKPEFIYSVGDGFTTEEIKYGGKLGFAIYNSGSLRFSEQTTDVGKLIVYEKLPWLIANFSSNESLNDEINEEELYKGIRQYIYEQVEMPSELDYEVLTCWILASWRYQEFQSFPYICALGPSDSGKTRLLETLHQLSYRGYLGCNMSTASIFRGINEFGMSIFFDQGEGFANSPEYGAMLQIFNNGYRKGGQVSREYMNPSTNKYETEYFKIYSPKAIASIDRPASSLASRCIIFNMRTNTRTEISSILNEKKSTEIRNKLLLYRFHYVGNVGNEEKAKTYEEKIKTITMDGRIRELFLPLLSIVPNSATLCTLSTPPRSIEDALLEYIRHRNQLRINEEQLRPEAELTHCITECSKTMAQSRILIDDISNSFNLGKSTREEWSNKAICFKLRDMGFETKRAAEGTVLINDAKLLSALQKKYSVTPTDCIPEV
ncbi:MAG: hypothetical protein ABSD42_03980 [Candidatus Bathyarchaeia archaeon]